MKNARLTYKLHRSKILQKTRIIRTLRSYGSKNFLDPIENLEMFQETRTDNTDEPSFRSAEQKRTPVESDLNCHEPIVQLHGKILECEEANERTMLLAPSTASLQSSRSFRPQNQNRRHPHQACVGVHWHNHTDSIALTADVYTPSCKLKKNLYACTYGHCEPPFLYHMDLG